jgi:hypothetical protein
MRNVVFYLGLGMLFTHEMDAMQNHEWRVLPILSSLPDATGEFAFLIAHVPIFAVVIAFVASLNISTRELAQKLACGFLIIHAALHLAFSGHADYGFSSLTSNLLIYGAALCGAMFLVMLILQRKQDSA